MDIKSTMARQSVYTASVVSFTLFAWSLLAYSRLLLLSGQVYEVNFADDVTRSNSTGFPNVQAIFRVNGSSIEMPTSVIDALKTLTSNGYLLGNSSRLTFHPYTTEVDLRIIVIVYNRATSLHTCLKSLEKVNYEGDKVSLHVWIDRHINGSISQNTLDVARQFNFSHGRYVVHLQRTHAGIQGQWTNTWRPYAGTNEIAVIFEDDMTVSPFFWKWLKAAHKFYDDRSDIAGYSLSHPGISHEKASSFSIPASIKIYAYKVIGTWGFSPHASKWRKYQDWFYASEHQPGFEPLVSNIIPTQWYLGEKRFNRQRYLWEMWHIYFSDRESLYTVYLNSIAEGLLTVNRHEKGLHDGHFGTGAREMLCRHWHDSFVKFPKILPKIGYNGQLELDKS